jgi:hypothetical protein
VPAPQIATDARSQNEAPVRSNAPGTQRFAPGGRGRTR